MNFVKIEKNKKLDFVKQNFEKLKFDLLKKIFNLKFNKVKFIYFISLFFVFLFVCYLTSFCFNIIVENKNFLNNKLFPNTTSVNSKINQTDESVFLDFLEKKTDIFHKEKFIIDKKFLDIKIDISFDEIFQSLSNKNTFLTRKNIEKLKRELEYVLLNKTTKDYIEIDVVSYDKSYEIRFFAFTKNEQTNKEDIKRLGAFTINDKQVELDKDMEQFMKENRESIRKLLYIVNLHLNLIYEKSISEEKNRLNKINGILN